MKPWWPLVRMELAILLRTREVYTFVLLPAALIAPVTLFVTALLLSFGGSQRIAAVPGPDGLDLAEAFATTAVFETHPTPENLLAAGAIDAAITAFTAEPDLLTVTVAPGSADMTFDTIRRGVERAERRAFEDRVVASGQSLTELRAFALDITVFDDQGTHLIGLCATSFGGYALIFLLPGRCHAERASGALEAQAVTRTSLARILWIRSVVLTFSVGAVLALPVAALAYVVPPWRLLAIGAESIALLLLFSPVLMLCAFLTSSNRMALATASYAFGVFFGALCLPMILNRPFLPVLGFAQSLGDVAFAFRLLSTLAMALGATVLLAWWVTRTERIFPGMVLD